MNKVAIADTLSLVSSQLEAASSLLKYAADDLGELLACHDVSLADDVRMIAQNLQSSAASIAGSGAFFTRLAEEHYEYGQSPAGWDVANI